MKKLLKILDWKGWQTFELIVLIAALIFIIGMFVSMSAPSIVTFPESRSEQR
jgi:hypothetical protein